MNNNYAKYDLIVYYNNNCYIYKLSKKKLGIVLKIIIKL